MPSRLSSRSHDEDTNGLNTDGAVAHEAGRQIACSFADYASDLRAWLDLNLESRRARGAGDGPGRQEASGAG